VAPRQEPENAFPVAERRLRWHNRVKVLRTVVQLAALAALAAYIVVSILGGRGLFGSGTPTAASGGEERTQSGEGSFIAISYPGLTRSKSLESKIVNVDTFSQQLRALKDSGYVTVTQQDVLNNYYYYGSLPEKALFLIFEDGIQDTVQLAQSVLEDLNYRATISTYANNLDDASRRFITAEGLRSLASNGWWEMGTNGYRLSYINVYDRYGNFFGNLNGSEYVKVSPWLWRDYNHYLMDFIRDEDRLRLESEAELRKRIQADYDLMSSTYAARLGGVPGLYILMHSNTGAFATDPIASDANREGMTGIFAMNFNRQGTCLNTLKSSVYDLSRLQVQSYFSTNHLLMRIQDDTGDDVAFVTGDAQQAENWYRDEGAAQFESGQITLTTQPRGEGRIALKGQMMADLDMTVTLKGNLIGCQRVNLRTDRDLKTGIQVGLEDNELVIRDLSQGGLELARQGLFELDGGPYISTQEDEYNGLVALQNAIIQYDEDPLRVAQAQKKLAELENTPVVTLADGGTPYYPELDVADRASRKLRIRLVGSRLSVWVDDRPAVEQLLVSGGQVGLGLLVLSAQASADEDEYSQRFFYDDVYDAVFVDPVVLDAQDQEKVLYSYTSEQLRTINGIITGWFNAAINFFLDNF